MRPFVVQSVILAVLSNGPLRAAEAPIPVMVGGAPELDACAATGVVSGLKPVQGNYLSVRAGPGLAFKRVDKLNVGERVWLCDTKDGWIGIVYGNDCGVATPLPLRRPYPGPCASGWVSERFIELEAG